MTPKSLAITIGLIFVAVGVLGFFENPIIGESADAIFHADSTHNYVHIASGLLFLLIAFAAPGIVSGFMIFFGLVYLAIGIIGFTSKGADGMANVLGFLHVNNADNYLHVALGLLIFLAGLARPRVRTR